jgi:hypothetical protein
MRAISAAIAIIVGSFHLAAAQTENRLILGPVVVEGSQWRGTFVRSAPTSNVRVRYSTSHCATARQYARTILAISDAAKKYSNVWMAVERSKGGAVEARSFTPPFELPAGTYSISVDGKTDNGKPHKLAVCVGVGDACSEFQQLAPSGC